MYTIDRVGIRGFRRLEHVDLPMKPFLVLIGANGVGKTSLLDAFSLLSASAARGLNDSLSDLGGLASLLTKGRAQTLGFQVAMEIPAQPPLEYSLQISAQGTGYAISQEILAQPNPEYSEPFKHIESSYTKIRYYDPSEKRLKAPGWVHDPVETSLSQVPRMFRQPEQLRSVLAATTYFHVLDVSPRAPVKLPQAMKPAKLPGANGEDLIPYLYTLRESDRHRFEAVADTLHAAFPGFEALSFPPVAKGLLTLNWKDKDYADPMAMHELSEGALRFLWLTALLESPSLPAITLIDEPEVSLHPELLSLLAELMRVASQRTQLIVATHSDRLIRFLRPEEVVVMDLDDDGAAVLRWADTLDLQAWLDEYSLDEVWSMGRMGGRA